MLFDTTAEEALLGAAMLRQDAAERVADMDPAMFTGRENRQIAERIGRMVAKEQPVDLATVCNRQKPDFPRMHAQALVESCPLPQNWETYVRHMFDQYADREYAQALSDITTGLAEGTLSRQEAEAALEGLRPTADPSFDALPSTRAGLDLLTDELERGVDPGMSTGWSNVDALIGGLQPGRLYVVAARTGQGKTMFALNLSLAVVRQQHRVAFFSLEQSEHELLMRLVAIQAGVEVPLKTDDHWADVLGACEFLSDDRWQGIYTEQTAGSVGRVSKGIRPALIVVDYLQLLSVDGRVKRYEALEAAGRRLKQAGKKLNAAVVILAQLNRQAMGDDGPQLHHLREASLEQDADVALILVPGADGELTLKVEKNRHGPTGSTMLRWHRTTGRMTVPPSPPPPPVPASRPQHAENVVPLPRRADIDG